MKKETFRFRKFIYRFTTYEVEVSIHTQEELDKLNSLKKDSNLTYYLKRHFQTEILHQESDKLIKIIEVK